jgi:hypothetical protein
MIGNVGSQEGKPTSNLISLHSRLSGEYVKVLDAVEFMFNQVGLQTEILREMKH